MVAEILRADAASTPGMLQARMAKSSGPACLKMARPERRRRADLPRKGPRCDSPYVNHSAYQCPMMYKIHKKSSKLSKWIPQTTAWGIVFLISPLGKIRPL